MSLTGQKKIPVRMCSGCMQRFPKKELIRVVRAPAGDISLDFIGKKSGRGAYVCKNPDCLKKARKAKRLERALETPIAPETYDALEEAMALGG